MPAAEMTETDIQQAKLALDQMRLALRNLKPNYWIMPIFAAIVSVMFARWVPVPRLVIWIALVTLAELPLAWAGHAIEKRNPPPEESRKWIWRCSAALFVASSAWASLTLFLWVPGSDMNHMLMILLIACTMVGTTALIGASRPLAIAGFIAYAPTLALIPLRETGAIYHGLFLLSLIYAGYVVHLARETHATASDLLTLRDDKNELIEALAKSKAASDAALDRAEAASRSKSQFLANMSHELRTPLNAILGFSEMIYSGAFVQKVDKHVEYARIIHESGFLLLALINDILDLAKMESGGLALRESNVDLAALIVDSARLIGAKAEAGGLAIKQAVPPNLPMLYADERALKQILLNLLSNAVKFTPPGGTVSVFAYMENDGGLTFGVRDTGLGIAEDDIGLVFQSFGQGRHDVVTLDKGTGLGLPIVKGLVEAHGGAVVLESKVGVGTCVTVHLPASRTSERHEPLEAIVA
jgi:two-component system cell cycle sensor histidine kinase PleC